MTDSPTPNPLPAVVAGAVTVAAVVTGALVDSAWVRAAAVAVGVAAAVVAVRLALRHDGRTGLAVSAAAPLTVLAIGVPSAIALDGGHPSAATVTVDAETLDEQPTDDSPGGLDEQLAEAFAQAERLLPGGSDTLLRIDVGDHPHVSVLDPDTGMRIHSDWSSGSGWSAAHSMPAVREQTFSRDDLAGLDLEDAADAAAAASEELTAMGASSRSVAGTDATIERRNEDGELVATVEVTDEGVQVDAEGRAADTIDLGSFDTVWDVVARLLVDLDLDPETVRLRSVHFKSVDTRSTIPSASGIQNSGGVEIAFASGPLQSVTVVPGGFPVVRERGSAQPTGRSFVLGDVTGTVLGDIRDDLAHRHRSRGYVRDAVGFVVDARGTRWGVDDPTITMSVGPAGDDAMGAYTFDGEPVVE